LHLVQMGSNDEANKWSENKEEPRLGHEFIRSQTNLKKPPQTFIRSFFRFVLAIWTSSNTYTRDSNRQSKWVEGH